MNIQIENQIGTRELREAAYHEAGHLTLLQCFGGYGAEPFGKASAATLMKNIGEANASLISLHH